MSKPSKKDAVRNTRALLKEAARDPDRKQRVRELAETLATAPPITRQLVLLRVLVELTGNNPAFRLVVLDELDKQTNAGRPATQAASVAYAQSVVEDAMRALVREHIARPRRNRRPTLDAALARAAERLGRSKATIRALWYLQPTAERDEAVRAYLTLPLERARRM